MGQKTGWWIGGAVLLVLGIVGVVVATGGESGAEGDEERSARAGGGDERPEILRPPARVRPAGEGPSAAPGASVTPGSVLAEAAAQGSNEDPDIARIMRGADEERSAGFLYGRARRQEEVLSERITRYTANAARLRAEGNEASADRQLRVVTRMTERLETVRTERDEQRSAAQADGTLSDEQAGYDEAQPVREGPPVQIRPPAEPAQAP